MYLGPHVRRVCLHKCTISLSLRVCTLYSYVNAMIMLINIKFPFHSIPRPVFQQSFASKRIAPTKLIEDEVITPQHEEIIRYINDCKHSTFIVELRIIILVYLTQFVAWNILVAQNPYDSSAFKADGKADANNNNASSLTTPNPVDSIIANTPVAASAAPAVWVEPPSPALNDFKPFDLESWWGRRLFQNITKSL